MVNLFVIMSLEDRISSCEENTLKFFIMFKETSLNASALLKG